MNWYDKIAYFYDFFSKKIYATARKELVENIGLRKGDTVLLIACGTGLSFDVIETKIQSEGLIIGIDNSKKMLEFAKQKIEKKGWRNIFLIHDDIRLLSPSLIRKYVGRNIEFDKVIGELAFSVIPDWEKVVDKSIELLKEDGKIGVLDGYRNQKDWFSRLLNFFPKSDVSRNISEYLGLVTKNYWSKKLGRTKILFIGIGNKKNNEQ